MKDKKSFIAYCDWIEVFDALPDEQAGKLVKHMFAYVNDLDTKTDDPMVNLAFIQIKQSLKRDLTKYEKYIKKQRENGAKGGRPKNPDNPTVNLNNPTEPKKADSVNDSVNDTVNVNDTNKPLSIRIEDFDTKVWEINVFNCILTKEDRDKFIDYWTEHGEKDKKARWEKEKVFDIKKRMERWKRNNKSSNYEGQSTSQQEHQRVHDELENSKLQQGNNK